jgi:hypothetical protein
MRAGVEIDRQVCALRVVDKISSTGQKWKNSEEQNWLARFLDRPNSLTGLNSRLCGPQLM